MVHVYLLRAGNPVSADESPSSPGLSSSDFDITNPVQNLQRIDFLLDWSLHELLWLWGAVFIPALCLDHSGLPCVLGGTLSCAIFPHCTEHPNLGWVLSTLVLSLLGSYPPADPVLSERDLLSCMRYHFKECCCQACVGAAWPRSWLWNVIWPVCMGLLFI